MHPLTRPIKEEDVNSNSTSKGILNCHEHFCVYMDIGKEFRSWAKNTLLSLPNLKEWTPFVSCYDNKEKYCFSPNYLLQWMQIFFDSFEMQNVTEETFKFGLFF